MKKDIKGYVVYMPELLHENDGVVYTFYTKLPYTFKSASGVEICKARLEIETDGKK